MKNVDADRIIGELELMYPNMVDEKDKQSVRFALEVLRGEPPIISNDIGMNKYQELAQRTSAGHAGDKIENGGGS